MDMYLYCAINTGKCDLPSSQKHIIYITFVINYYKILTNTKMAELQNF